MSKEEIIGYTKNKIEYIKKQPKIDWVSLKYYEGVLNLVDRLEAIEALDNIKPPSEDLKYWGELLNTFKRYILEAIEQKKENDKYKRLFDIIKKKKVDIQYLIRIIKDKTIEDKNKLFLYNYCAMDEEDELNNEEFDLFKEMFKMKEINNKEFDLFKECLK